MVLWTIILLFAKDTNIKITFSTSHSFVIIPNISIAFITNKSSMCYNSIPPSMKLLDNFTIIFDKLFTKKTTIHCVLVAYPSTRFFNNVHDCLCLVLIYAILDICCVRSTWTTSIRTKMEKYLNRSCKFLENIQNGSS